MVDRLANQDRGLESHLEQAGLVLARYRSVYIARRSLFRGAAGGVVLAGLAQGVAYADSREPEVFPRADGRVELTARLDAPGDGVLYYGPQGVKIGLFYPGPTVYAAVAAEANMSLTAIGDPELYANPILVTPDGEVLGEDYTPWVRGLREPMQDKRREIADSIDGSVRGINVALVFGGLNRIVFHKEDLDTSPGRGTLPDFPARLTRPTGVGVTAAQEGVGAAQVTGECDPLQVTTLAPRPDAMIDGKPVPLPVRDKNFGCERALWLKETGVRRGENFKLDLPGGWSVVISPTTVAVHREGGVQRDFLKGDVVVVNGPFRGGAGVYEGWIGVLPTEWSAKVANERLVIQRIQNGRPDSQVVTFVG